MWYQVVFGNQFILSIEGMQIDTTTSNQREPPHFLDFQNWNSPGSYPEHPLYWWGGPYPLAVNTV